MSDQTVHEPRTWKFGAVLFAGIMMVTVGAFDLIRGLVGLFSNDILSKPDYLFAFNATTWGWIHVVIGLFLIGVGLLVVAGRVIGRVLGILVVFGSAMLNFASLPYAPIWSALMIAIDVLVIWALATYGAEPEDV